MQKLVSLALEPMVIGTVFLSPICDVSRRLLQMDSSKSSSNADSAHH